MSRVMRCMFMICVTAGLAGAGVIYQDNFNKTGRVQGAGYTQVLKASLPTVTTGGQWWKSYYSSTVNSLGINESGTMNTYTSTSSGYYRNAFLDFTPQSGKIYTLTVDMSVENIVNGSGFITAGFSANTALIDSYATITEAAAGGTYASGEYVSDMTTAVGGWVLNANQSASTYKDAEYAGSVSAGTTPAGFNTYTVILNTQGENWTAEWKLNGTSVRTETYTEEPVIRNVFLGVAGVADASFQDFSLSVVPEPGSVALLGAGSAIILICRRRYQV